MASSSCLNQGSVPMNNNNASPYPCPLATYEEVVANPKLFMVTLEKFHSALGTKFMIPIIGGKDLDLHRLFIEVTSRGGIEKIIKERRWKEVTSTFSFPATATNASFVLRKYYFSLLHNYELSYFFKTRDYYDKPLIPFSARSPRVRPSSELEALQLLQSGVPFQESPSAGSKVVGYIDGKFESGYLVTVSVGSEKLRGVLYHVQDNTAPSTYGGYSNKWMINPLHQVMMRSKRRRRRNKSEMKRRDPDHPKPNRSGYNFFFAEQHARLKPLHPGKDRDISRMIGVLWNRLNEEEKSVYQGKAVEDKERYRTEMEVYREKQRAGEPISNAVPLQQRLLKQDVDMVEADATMEEVEEEGDSSNGSGESDHDDDDQNCDSDAELEEGSPDPMNTNLPDETEAPKEKPREVMEEPMASEQR